jgi:carbonic anhydrase
MRSRLLVLLPILVGALGLVAGKAAPAFLGPRGSVLPELALAADEKPSVSPEQALQRLKAGNNRFVEGMSEKPDLGASRRQELTKGQNPFAVVLTCADSRLTPEFIFNQGLGDLFVLRVAGNIADQYEIGSIEYAVDHLHVPLVVVLGHENCGAVEAALGHEKPAGNLGKLIAEIDIGKDLPAEADAALMVAIKNNIRHQAQLLTEHSDDIKEHVTKKQVRVVSGIYQLGTGKVEWLEEH